MVSEDAMRRRYCKAEIAKAKGKHDLNFCPLLGPVPLVVPGPVFWGENGGGGQDLGGGGQGSKVQRLAQQQACRILNCKSFIEYLIKICSRKMNYKIGLFREAFIPNTNGVRGHFNTKRVGFTISNIKRFFQFSF